MQVKHRFLTYDRKVLRFCGIWDDRKNLGLTVLYLALTVLYQDLTVLYLALTVFNLVLTVLYLVLTVSYVQVKHRFLTYDRKVLRFYGIWDDRKSIFGERYTFNPKP
jgi:hypothetical protein